MLLVCCLLCLTDSLQMSAYWPVQAALRLGLITRREASRERYCATEPAAECRAMGGCAFHHGRGAAAVLSAAAGGGGLSAFRVDGRHVRGAAGAQGRGLLIWSFVPASLMTMWQLQERR